MSNIKVTDRRGGNYQAEIEFSYGECERLPFNILRRIDATVAVVPDGGIKVYADFNIRTPGGSAAFLEMLDMFGEDGSYEHGSAADPDSLALSSPQEKTGTVRMTTAEDEDDLELEGTLNNAK